MIKIENHCNCCDLPCVNCGLKHVPVYYCDECGYEIEDDGVYEVDGDDLCEDCLKEKFKKEVEY